MKRLSVAIDYTDEYSQICYYNESEDSVFSVSSVKEENRFLIYPTEEETLNNDYYNFFSRIFLMLKSETGNFEIEKIAVTLKQRDENKIAIIFDTFVKMGISDKKIDVILYNNSFAYYVINQDKKIWSADVMLINYDKKNILELKRLNINDKKKPYYVTITEDNFDLPIAEEMFDEYLEKLIEKEMKKGRISSFYLAGEGFDKSEIPESLKYMCRQSRVFIGKNLFAQGACYSIIEREKVNYRDFCILCQERTIVDVAVLVEHKNKNERLLLSTAGADWRNEKYEECFLLDNIKKIDFDITSVLTGNTSTCVIDLNDFPERKNKTTKILISLWYDEKEKIIIEIKDLGFGEFFKSSGKIIKETISVANI